MKKPNTRIEIVKEEKHRMIIDLDYKTLASCIIYAKKSNMKLKPYLEKLIKDNVL